MVVYLDQTAIIEGMKFTVVALQLQRICVQKITRQNTTKKEKKNPYK